MPTDRILESDGPWADGSDGDGDDALTLSSVGDDPFEPFSLRVNFQPESSTTVPPRFRADIGREFARRANGLTYGWSFSNEPGLIDRNSPRSEPLGEQYDTFAFTNGRNWSVQVPNGWYSVTVVAGEPENYSGQYRFAVEGTPFLDGRPVDAYRWVEGQTVVRVDDGKLTIEEFDRPVGSRMAFLFVDRVPAPVEPFTAAPMDFTVEGTAPLDRIEAGIHREGNLVYVAGGYTNDYLSATSRFDVYNVVDQTWTRLADLPGPESHFSFFSDGRFLYKLGGQNGNVGGDRTDNSSDVGWKYDIDRDRWTPWFDLPEARLTAAATFYNGRVHVVAGNDPNGISAADEHWFLDFDNVEAGWQEAAPLPRAADHSGQLLADTPDGTRWFIFGGEHGHGVSYVQHKEVFAYDFDRDVWERKTDMPEAGSHFEGNVFFYAGKVWLLGARGNANTRLTNIWSYDLATDRWTTHGELPQGRFGGASWGLDGRLYFAMGDVFGRSRDDILVAELR
ncbi:MAG: kelch repeat-containing protein [Planctomycetota bacterium]